MDKLILMLLICLCGPGLGVAEAGPKDGPLTAQAVLDGAAQFYHRRPVAETVLVRVTSADGRRTEQVGFRSRPERRQRDWKETHVNVELDLGDTVVWTDRDQFLGIHRLNATTYFETRTTDAQSHLDVLRETLPPLPVPQLDLIDGHGSGYTQLTPYAKGIRWSDRVEEVDAGRVRLRGRAESSVVELEVHPRSFRLQYLMIDVERGSAVIEVVFRTPDAGSRRGVLGESIEGRARVDALTDLRERAGDISPGFRLPDLLMTPVGDVPPGAGVIAGPGAILVFKSDAKGIDDAVLGVREALDESLISGVWALVVHDLGSGDFDAAMARVQQQVEPTPLHFSLSARTTLRRFAETADGVVVIIDDKNVVRGVAEIDPQQDAAEYVEQIRRVAGEPAIE